MKTTHLSVEGGITRCIDYRLLATTTRHWGCYGAPLKEVERVTSVMIECSYSKDGAYDWRFTLSGLWILNGLLVPGRRCLCWGMVGG